MNDSNSLPELAWFEAVRDSFRNYCELTPWDKGGDVTAKRLEKAIETHSRTLRELPKNFLPAAMDTELAAVWHATHTRSGGGAEFAADDPRRFGAKPWVYRSFIVVEVLDQHRYRCLDDDKIVSEVWSPALTVNLKEGKRCFLGLMIDVGKDWWMTYGPLFGWSGLLPGDLRYLASRVAPQQLAEEGFDAVVRTHPVAFWAAWRYSGSPAVYHGPRAVLFTWLEGSLDPTFGDSLPKTWLREDVGGRTRWTNGTDFFAKREIYLNGANGEALLLARRDEDIGKLRKLVGSKFAPRGKVERCGVLMDVIIKSVLEEDSIAANWERPFTGAEE